MKTHRKAALPESNLFRTAGLVHNLDQPYPFFAVVYCIPTKTRLRSYRLPSAVQLTNERLPELSKKKRSDQDDSPIQRVTRLQKVLKIKDIQTFSNRSHMCLRPESTTA